MTGNQIYHKVLGILGYMESDDMVAGEETLLKRALDIINQICNDLKVPQIKRLSDTIKATDQELDALCYGTAMIMCLVEGDGVKNQMFTSIYNAKRATVLSKTEIIDDKLPFVADGVG